MPEKKKKKKTSEWEDDEEVPGEVEDHEEQDEADKLPEEYKESMRENKTEVTVYTDEGREELEDDDEIEDWEAGFSKGAQPDKHHE